MAILHVNKIEHDEEIKKGTVLVDFYAEWCGPCKMLAPNLETFAASRPDIKILKVNVDEETELASFFEVFTVPTLFLYKEGEIVDKKVGFQTVEMLNEWLR